MDELEGKLAPLLGTHHLSGIRSRKIAKLLLIFLPLFAFAFVAAFIKSDQNYLFFFGIMFLIVVLVSSTLYYGLRRINQLECNAKGVTFLPVGIHISIEEINKIESAPNPNGGDIYVISLQSPRFIPYFGLVWCFGKVLAINTEPEVSS